MTLEADIVEALRTSSAAHQANLAEIAKLRAETAALTAAAVSLEAEIAGLEAEAVNVVEPAAAQPVIDDLLRVVEETFAALRPGAEPAAPSPPPGPETATAPDTAGPAVIDEPPDREGPQSNDEDAATTPRPRSSARGWGAAASAAPEATALPPTATRREPSSRLSRFGFRLN